MSRAFMRSYGGDAVGDTRKSLQDPLEVVVSELPRLKVQMLGSFAPQGAEHLLARQRVSLGFKEGFANAFQKSARGSHSSGRVAFDGSVGALVFLREGLDASRLQILGERDRGAGKRGAQDDAATLIGELLGCEGFFELGPLLGKSSA